MFKGTSASAGIGIGKAVIVEEAELVITRNEVADAEAEIQRFKGALEKTIAATQKMADDLASRERKRLFYSIISTVDYSSTIATRLNLASS